RRQLKKAFQRRRVVMQALAGIGRELHLNPGLEPIRQPVLDLVDRGFAAAENEVVLELDLAGFDDRTADFEVLGLRLIGTAGSEDRARDDAAADPTARHYANATHAQLLLKVRGKAIVNG